MAEKVFPRGHLVAVDGSRGKDVSSAAEALAGRLRRRDVECVISRWDASGLFGELAQAGRPGRHISPRTLSLVYAADLAFRLRWEIRTAIETGGVVIAAPYVETAVAFGSACGLPANWLRELLRFAPAPNVRGIVRERKSESGWKARLDRGYGEYGAALFEEGSADFKSKRTRRAMIEALEADHGRKVFQLSGKGIAQAAKAVIGSRPAASSRSASRRRNERR
jgi:thymidylate kinase